MADRIPLIVDSSSNQVKELPAGDSIILADNEKLKVGTGGDLQISHSGTNSVIDNNTGGLYIRNNVAADVFTYISVLVIQDGTGSRTLTWNAMFEFKDDTAPTLTTTASKGDLFTFRYNGAKWLEVGRNQNLSLS